jgi:hypothetical protein
MEVAGLALAIVAILLTIAIEVVRRPRLSIRPSRFTASGPVPWTFAAVRVHNKPLSRPWRWFLTREAAGGCRVTFDFFRWGTDVRVMPSVPGRWSGNPQPLRRVRQSNPETEQYAEMLAKAGLPPPVEQYFAEYDPTLDPREHDVRTSEDGEEVAVAVLQLQVGAYAWGTESYAHPSWQKPGWQLEHGTYKVVVSVNGSSVSKSKAFKLEYLDDDFAKFNLI